MDCARIDLDSMFFPQANLLMNISQYRTEKQAGKRIYCDCSQKWDDNPDSVSAIFLSSLQFTLVVNGLEYEGRVNTESEDKCYLSDDYHSPGSISMSGTTSFHVLIFLRIAASSTSSLKISDSAVRNNCRRDESGAAASTLPK